MKRVHSVPLILIILFVCSACVALAQAGNSRPVSCRYETTAGIPSYFTTGVWRGGSLLLADIIHHNIVEVSKTGVATEFRTAIGDYLAGNGVARIRSGTQSAGTDAAQVLVEFDNGNLLNLDRSLIPKHKLELSTTELRSGGNKLGPLLDWTLTGNGREVVGYADIEGPGKGLSSWKNGFVRFSLENPRSFTILHEHEFPGDLRVVMNIGYPLLASLDSTAYVAMVDDQKVGLKMGLWRFSPDDKSLQPMRAFPEQLKHSLAPLLPNFRGAEEFPNTMRAVEQATMPAGLFAWENALFIVSRTFDQGQRKWYLSKIDPAKDELLWTVRIPGSAHHMTVIPGPNEWAFLEKGPLSVPLNQTTHHIRFVKSSQMQTQLLSTLCN